MPTWSLDSTRGSFSVWQTALPALLLTTSLTFCPSHLTSRISRKSSFQVLQKDKRRKRLRVKISTWLTSSVNWRTWNSSLRRPSPLGTLSISARHLIKLVLSCRLSTVCQRSRLKLLSVSLLVEVEESQQHLEYHSQVLLCMDSATSSWPHLLQKILVACLNSFSEALTPLVTRNTRTMKSFRALTLNSTTQ